MLTGEKILFTGATGKIAFPIARELAKNNEVWGAARLQKPGDKEKLAAVGITPHQLDMASGDFSNTPDDFSYVFHAAVDPGRENWQQCVQTNAQRSGDLLYHCRKTKGFVFCSTGSIYRYDGKPLKEDSEPGAPLRGNYSFSKVAGEEVCKWIGRRFNIPLTIIRICSTYGPEGGAPCDRLEAMLNGKPVVLHPDKPNNYNPIYEDDYVELGIRAMEAADCPAVTVNWSGSETVSAEDYCNYLAELAGIKATIEYSEQAHTPLWPDTNYMHEVLGKTKVHWKDGMRRMVEARHPELLKK